jgi:SSS family solute:Na+ symporter
MSSAQFINLAVVIGYLLLIIGVGVYFGFKRKSAAQFMVANQSMPGWAVGLSMFGSYISSISFLANPSAAYATNWMWAGFTIVTPFGLWVGTHYFMRFYRDSGAISAYSHLEARFGAWARSYAVFTYLVIQMVRMGTILYLLSQAVLPLLGGDPVHDLTLVRGTIIAIGLLMTCYTLFGGIEAVVWTGVLQSAILIIGPLICIVTLLLKMPGGLFHVVQIGIVDHKFGFGPYSANLIVPTFWLVLLSAVLEHLRNWGLDQSYVQRYLSAKSDREASRSIWIAGLLFIPVSMFFWFIGTALHAFYKVMPERLPAGTPADSVFPHFISFELLPGLSGLVIAAIFAASMDSNLNSMATLTLMDGYKRYVRPRATDRESLWVLYGSTLFWGAMSIAYGLIMTLKGGTPTVDFSARVAGLVGGGILGLFLLGILWRKVPNGIAFFSTAAGIAVIVWMSVSRWPIWPQSWAAYRSPWHELTTTVIGTLLILLLGFGLTLLSQFWNGTPPRREGACQAAAD